MAKIVRKTQKLFASTAGGTDIGVYGSLASGSPAYSTDPDVIQSLSAFLQGWFGETVGNKCPAIQDMNALDFLAFRQIAYILQAGVAEWDAGTTYYTGSLAQNGAGVIYKSLTDTNLNNALSNGTYWSKLIGTAGALDAGALAGQVITWASGPKYPAGDGSQLTNLNIPTSYDSGWFAKPSNGATITKTHSLGTTKVIALLYMAEDSSGTNMQWRALNEGQDNARYGYSCRNITTTTVDVTSAGNGGSLVDSSGGLTRTATYARVIIIALP